MGRPRKAVAAAVLASAIGIDRSVEGNIGRIVCGDDLLWRLDEDLCLERRQIVERIPAVVEKCPRMRLVAPRHVDARSPSARLVGKGGRVGRYRRFAIGDAALIDERDHDEEI